MARRRRGQVCGGAEALRGQIEWWREAGRPGKRMPEELWGAAVELAHEHGAYRIAGELGVSYAALKQRTEETAGKRRKSDRGKTEGAEFVEIDIAPALAREVGGATEIEMVREDGLRLRIRLGAREPLDLEAVTAAFVGSRR